MKQNMIPLADTPPAQSSVHVLKFRGRLLLDPDPLANVYESQGEDAAEDTVCRTLADIASRLGDLQCRHERGAFAEIPMPARRIAAISGQIGLIEMAIAAEHVANAAAQSDGIALEATLSRLERCFDLAMTEVWSFQSF